MRPPTSTAPAARSVPLPRGELVAQSPCLLLELADTLERITHLDGKIVARTTHQSGQFGDECIARLDFGERTLAGHRLDATHAGGDSAFRDDLEKTDVARARDVRTAAELHRKITDAQHAYLARIFFTEERHRSGGHRSVVLHLSRLGDGIDADLLVDAPLDALQFLGRDRLKVGEVETQPIWRD